MSKKSAIKKILKDDGSWTEDYSDVTGCMVIIGDESYYFIDVNRISVSESGSILLHNVPEDCSEKAEVIATFPSPSVAYLVKYDKLEYNNYIEVRTYDV